MSTGNIDNNFNETDEIHCLDAKNLTTNLWFNFEEYNFYYSKISDCIYIFDDNLDLFFYSNRNDCSFDSVKIYNISECLNRSYLTQKNDYENFLNKSIEYDPHAKNITIFKKIKKEGSKIKSIHFHLINSQKSKDISEIQLPEEVINEIRNISDIPNDLNLLIFKADITKNDTKLTQVEFQFYNPIPSKINEKIIFLDTESNNLRRLDDIYLNISGVKIILTLPIDFTKEENYTLSKGICIFDESHDFFTNICYKYTSLNNTDIYKEERKHKFYRKQPSCKEINCSQLYPVNNFSCWEPYILSCQCPIKIKFDEVSNSSDESPYNRFSFSNIMILQCFNETLHYQIIKRNFGFYINFISLIIYLGAYIIFKRNFFFLKFIICSFLNIISCKNCFEDKFKDLNKKILEEMEKLKPFDDSKDDKDEIENHSSSPEHEYKEDEKNNNFKIDNDLIRAYDDDDDLFDLEKENLIDSHTQQKEQEKKVLKISDENISSDNKSKSKKDIAGKDENEYQKSTQTIQINVINLSKELYKEDIKEIKKDDNNKKDDLIEEEEKEIKKDKNKKVEIIDEDNQNINSILNQNNDSLPKEIIKDHQSINNEINFKNNNEDINKSDSFSNKNNSNDGDKGDLLKLKVKDKKKENNNEENNIKINEEQNKKNSINLYEILQKRRNIKNKRLIKKNNNLINDDNKFNEADQKNNNNKDKDDYNGILNSEQSILKNYNQIQNPYDIDSESNYTHENNSIGNQIFDDRSKIIDSISRESEENHSKSKTSEKKEDLISNNEFPNNDNLIDKKNENKEDLECSVLDVNNSIKENSLSLDNNESKENPKFKNNFTIQSDKRKSGNKNANPPKMRGDNNPNENQNGDLISTDELIKKPGKDDIEKCLNYYSSKVEENLKKNFDRIEYNKALKKDDRSFWKMFYEIFMKNNTFVFIISFCEGNDDFYAKISIAILSIYLYIFINILLMFDSSGLYLYIKKGEEEYKTEHIFLNIIVPYMILNYPINKLKKYILMKENIVDIYDKLYNTLIRYCNFILENKKKKLNKSELNLKIHNIETEISLTRNTSDKRARKLFIFGGLFIIFSWYYFSCFCEIYPNSVDSLIINVIISIISASIISLISYLISAGCRKAAIKNERKYLFIMSNLLNPKYEFCKKGKTKKNKKTKQKDKINKAINVNEN